MIAVGRYLLLIATLLGVILSVDGRFSKEDIDTFLDYIFRLHNAVRLKHDARKLERTNDMDVNAYKILNQKISKTENDDNELGVVYIWNYYNDETQLDVAEAIQLFSGFYEEGNFYNYELNSPTNGAVNFTQILWQDTIEIGLAFVYNSNYNNRYTVLAVYSPRGNIEGRYTYNVHRPINTLPASDPDIPGLTYQTKKEKFLANILEMHNRARANHKVKELRRDDEMDALAEFILQNGSKIGPQYGVNSLEDVRFRNIKLGDEAAANQVFAEWYNGEPFYSYENGPDSNSTDSFTQIVWKNTKRIGMSIRRKIGGSYDIIVLYKPRGNIREQYTSNVRRPKVKGNGWSYQIQGESSRGN